MDTRRGLWSLFWNPFFFFLFCFNSPVSFYWMCRNFFVMPSIPWMYKLLCSLISFAGLVCNGCFVFVYSGQEKGVQWVACWWCNSIWPVSICFEMPFSLDFILSFSNFYARTLKSEHCHSDWFCYHYGKVSVSAFKKNKRKNEKEKKGGCFLKSQPWARSVEQNGWQKTTKFEYLQLK